MNFKNLPMKKDFNVFKIVLALLLVLGSQESVQGQFGMGGFGGYGYNPYSGMGRMRSSVPRTNVAAEPEAPLTPAPAPARGSLAGSIAKPVTVTQEAMPDPRKPKGPSRI